MTGVRRDAADSDAVANQDRPAVGAIVTETNTDAVARLLLRADRRGYEVLLTHHGNRKLTGLQFGEQLSAAIVHPKEPNPDRDHLVEELQYTARRNGYPGLLFHRDPATPIDYDASIDKLEASSSYLVTACSKRAGRTERDVVVAIPAYNEASTVAEVVREATLYADTVLVVDDGSDDATAYRAEEAGAVVIRHETNRGYGASLKTAFEFANDYGYQYLVTLDADGQHLPADIPKLLGRQRETDADVVIGSRFTEGGTNDAPLYRRFGLVVINVLTNLSFGVVRPRSWITDTQSGFRVYSARAVRTLASGREPGDGMSASIDILYQAHDHDLSISEVGTTIRYDGDAASSLHPVVHGFTLLNNIFKTTKFKRPMIVLGIPGFLSMFTVLWYLTLQIQTVSLETAAVSVFLFLVGFLLIVMAILLYSLKQFRRHREDAHAERRLPSN